MGGLGSGRRGYGSAPTCEGTCSIDLAWLRRHRMLEPGRIPTITWSIGGERTGEISLAAQTNGVRLLYNITGRDGTKTSINELVPFAYTATMFGGRRQWFMCLKCGRRCRRIFGGRYFRCRQCYGLAYASTREPPHQRAIDRADRLRKRVGGGRGAFDGEDFPPKPPRMRWRTYRRLQQQYEELLGRWTVGVMAGTAQLLERLRRGRKLT
jgi:hypothetical protein